MRPYLAVIIDSFRAAMASWVLYIMLIVITGILVFMAPVGYEEELTTSLYRQELVDPLGLLERLEREGKLEKVTPAQRIWKKLDEPLRKQIVALPAKLVKASRGADEADRAIQETNALLDRLTGKIEVMLEDDDFFDEQAWRGVELDKEAHELIEKGLRQLPEPDWAAASRENGSPIKIASPDEITYDQWRKLGLKEDIKSDLLKKAKARLTQEELGRLNRLALDSAFIGMINASSRTSMRFYWAMFDTGQSIQLRRQELSDILNASMPFIVDKFVLSIGMIVAIIVTAPIVPQMFEPGSLNLLLSKPVSRWMLFLAKFVGGCAFTLLCAGYLFGGVWLLLGFRLGIWHQGILLSIPIYVFVFAIYFTVSAIAGVIWRNSIVSVIVAVLFWGLCWLVGALHWGLGTVSLPLFRPVALAPVGDEIPLYVNRRDAVHAWNKREGEWDEALKEDVARAPELGARMMGPVVDAQRGQISIVRTNLGGRPTLVTARRDERWEPQQVGQAPLGSQFLFREPDGDLIVLTALGELYRVQGDPLEVLRRIEQAGEEKSPTESVAEDSSDSDGDSTAAIEALAKRLNVFLPAGPVDKPIPVFQQPFAAAMHPSRPLLATYSRGVITLHEAGDDGQYKTKLQGKRLPGNETLPAVMAASEDRLIVARGDGKVLLVGLKDLKVAKEFDPGADGLAITAIAEKNGRWAAVLFQDSRLYLIDLKKKEMELAAVDHQGTITSVAFGDDGRLWLASHEQQVTEYLLGDPLKADRHVKPALDFQQKVYYYFVKPAYTICPKPGEFYKTVQYLLLDGDDNEAITNSATRAIRATLDPWAPVWSGALFIAVMLGLACVYIERQDF